MEEEMSLWDKIKGYVALAAEGLLGLMAVVLGGRALRQSLSRPSQQEVAEARDEQRLEDTQAADTQARAAQVQAAEAHQAQVHQDLQKVQADMDAAKLRIEGMSDEQVAAELHAFDIADGQPKPPEPPKPGS